LSSITGGSVAGAGDPRARFRTLDESDRARSDHRLFERLADPDDPVDRDVVVERFLPLARRLAARYRGGDEPFDDVFQIACLGLVNAVERYDPARGKAFTSFAVPTIVGEIKRHFRDRTWSIRPPRDLQEQTLRVERARDELGPRLGRAPTVDDIATHLGIEPEDVLEAMAASRGYRAASLDSPRPGGDEDGDETVGDTVGTDDAEYERAEERATLDRLMRSLTARERLVLRLRFEDDLTQQEIGARIGVSQMQVSRIVRNAVDRLRLTAAAEPRAAAARSPNPPHGASGTVIRDQGILGDPRLRRVQPALVDGIDDAAVDQLAAAEGAALQPAAPRPCVPPAARPAGPSAGQA
jgi:RNA polymerase sigma-B factor